MSRLSFATLVATLLGTGPVIAQESSTIELVAPRSPSRGDGVEIQITTGQLPRGGRLIVSTEQGKILGAVDPFGPPTGSSTATVPIPNSAVAGRSVRLRLQVMAPGVSPRPPRPDEVRGVEVLVVPRR